MKIKSFKTESDMLVVTTDNKDRPEFVYPVGRFKTKTALIAEIDKSLLFEKRRNTKIFNVQKALEVELNAGD